MKFSCDKCSARYTISDEKVRGKLLKIRCKSCGNVIEVRDPAAGGHGAGPASPSQGALRAQRRRPAQPARPVTGEAPQAREGGESGLEARPGFRSEVSAALKESGKAPSSEGREHRGAAAGRAGGQRADRPLPRHGPRTPPFGTWVMIVASTVP